MVAEFRAGRLSRGEEVKLSAGARENGRALARVEDGTVMQKTLPVATVSLERVRLLCGIRKKLHRGLSSSQFDSGRRLSYITIQLSLAWWRRSRAGAMARGVVPYGKLTH
jgi:hypothetical protein